MKSKRIHRYPCVVQTFINLTSRGQLREAVDTLPLLSRKGFSLNSKLIALLLQQCAKSKSIKEGKWVHLHLKLTGGKHPNTFLANHLINMYAKCGDHVKAREVFDKMRDRNLYSWNNMLAGYASLGMAKAAKRLFDRMPERDFVSWNTMVMACVQSGWFDQALRFYMVLRRLGIGFNEYSFAGVLTVCVKLRELWLAKQLHCQVFLIGFLSNVVLSSSVLDAYAKCGEMGDASRLFDEMRKKDVLAWTTLVSAYARWGDMKAARQIFDSMPEKNSVSWTALIAGYTHNGMGRHALKLFAEMVMLNVEPDQLTLSSCLLACASLISLEQGRQLHSHMITAGTRPNVVVVSSLIDMYSKCGSLEVAKRVFDTIENKQHVGLWNTMISAFGHQGCGKQAINFFVNMVRLGVKPDGVTFHALLSACCHSALVKEGLCLFESMIPDYNIIPDQEHYSYLIDLLGRSGLFDELTNHLKKMPCKPDDHVWSALLGVCRIYGNVELARLMARHLVELEPQSTAAYLLLSGMYAALGRWEFAEEVRQLMDVRHPEKDQALSWLEIDRKLHLDTKINKPCHPEKETTLVLELLPDGSSLYNVER
ncbi:Pentatricopeptide repeat-containing protein [Sesamum angolense]|uniref:Pentatricopeptide repeat-containing protein n=1 Tax=Sesamum angolense TaxID=2727404 RepID=A0AAE1WY83_9LAMI|nr:Pentatricopeptide repeat-containing protein [Sesamum angolense]